MARGRKEAIPTDDEERSKSHADGWVGGGRGGGERQEVKFSSVYFDTYEFDENFIPLQKETNTRRPL